ncbi:putative reverse transcriptase domain-containing protein, partial [Tanacetum coccineum]
MAPKRTSTSAAPPMTQAAIRKLAADSVAAALEAQAATMANTDNTTRNTRQRETPVARKCSYKEFMNCQPFNFKGTEGAVGLICWFERTESVFLRSNCTEDCKVKFATGTLTEEALSWWNSFAQPIGIKEAYKITWSEFKQLLIKKFQELAVLCSTMVPNSEKLMEVFIGGLPRSIEGIVTASKPHTLEKAITITQRLMDQMHPTSYRTLHYQVSDLQQGGSSDQELQEQRASHWKQPVASVSNLSCLWRERALQKSVPKSKHQYPRKSILAEGQERSPRPKRADKSFVSISLASMLNILPITLDTTYDIEMADGNLVGTNTVIQGYTLILLNQPFEIDLMSIKLGSFNVIIGMDWLSKYHARIICDEKVVHIPIDGETLIIRAQVMEKKSDEKRLEDIRVVREFSKVFLENLPCLPSVRQRTRRSPENNTGITQKEKLYAKFSKCDFWISIVQFLRHVIDSRGIHVDPAKIEAVKNWASPTTPTEIHQFLGLAGYYRRFIEGFSKIAKPLTELTQKNKKYIWGENQESAFQLLKQKLCEAPILALPKGNNNFVVYCDASLQGLGAV